ncbi:MAG: ATP-binding protein [Verrucomicrobiales bacterium]
MNPVFLQNALFGGIPREELHGLDLAIEECHFSPDEVIFEEGDEGEHVYLVAEGSVRISKKGRLGRQETLTVQSEGGFFGEMALFDHQLRSARATALEPCILGRMGRDGLDRFLTHSPEAALHFIRTFSKQLRSASSLFIKELQNAERLSLVGTMMSSIVHDFRNPIATLSLVSDFLEQLQHQDSTLWQLGELAREAIDQMLAMIQELLEYSRGTSNVKLETTSVADLMRSLDEQTLNPLEREGLEVRREFHYSGEITVDRNRVLRLFGNITKNAYEAMLPNKGRLTLRSSLQEDAVLFEVQDTGCGIPKEILSRMFEPFLTHGKKEGTGLGMAIAKSVVEAHNGKIWMESEPGKGTICHIALPLKP